MFSRRIVVGLAIVVWVASNCGSAWAQGRRRAPGPEPKFAELQLVGEVQQVMPGWVQVKSGADQLWTIQVPPTAKVEIKGKAKPEALAPGQFISFVATVDQKTGKVENKISKAMLFTPDAHRPPGALPESFAGAFDKAEGKEGKAKEGKAEGGGFGQFGGGGGFGTGGFGAGGFGAGAGAKSGRKSKSPGKAAQPTGPQSFEIRGQITGVQNGAMNIRVPPNVYFQRSSLMVEIAEDADIDVELSNAQAIVLARKGDKIQIRGQQMGPTTGRVSQADVTLSEPLGATVEQSGKKGLPKFDKRSRVKRGADDEEATDEEPKAIRKGAKKGKKDAEEAGEMKADGEAKEAPQDDAEKAEKKE